MRRYNIAAGCLFIVLLIALFAMGPRNTQRIQSAFLGIISPFLRTGSSLERKVREFREGMKTINQLEQDNQGLLVQNKELKAINSTLRDLERENNRLRAALGYHQRATFNLIPARIITRDSATWWSTVQIDRGSADGIQPDMPVLTESGLVGKTTVVSDNASTVLLVSDENCKVAAMIEGSRERGIVRGGRTSTAAMPDISLSFISKNAGLKPQQKIYTSGVGGVYPAGIFIGEVREFKARELDGFATIVPAVDLSTIEDVFVVTGSPVAKTGKGGKK
jgi:rod shape-determining protein MreC